MYFNWTPLHVYVYVYICKYTVDHKYSKYDFRKIQLAPGPPHRNSCVKLGSVYIHVRLNMATVMTPMC